ncbi:MAG: cation:proton antiporter [Candidatus Nanopelagicales bacterium]
MELPLIVLVALLIVGFGLAAERLQHWQVTAPLAFTAAGFLVGWRTDAGVAFDHEGIKLLAEVTLVLILFHDASQVRVSQLRHDAALPARLLLVGFPLTVLVGTGLTAWLLPAGGVWAALLIGAALAPTDAGLGAATVLNPAVPVRVRRTLNVESGLNDGLATPVVIFAIVALAGEEGLGPGVSVLSAARELSLGLVVGIVLAWLGARLFRASRSHRWSTAESRSFAVLALAILCWGAALLIEGNGFIAAFVGGLVFGSLVPHPDGEQDPEVFVERVSLLTGIGVWLLFGAVGVPLAIELFQWQYVVLAVLLLTVARAVPVALSLLGSGLRWPTIAFLGWFGPRGLASLVFLLLAAEELQPEPPLADAAGVITVTVLLSVVLHGVTASPLATRYGAWAARTEAPILRESATEPRSRRWTLGPS